MFWALHFVSSYHTNFMFDIMVAIASTVHSYCCCCCCCSFICQFWHARMIFLFIVVVVAVTAFGTYLCLSVVVVVCCCCYYFFCFKPLQLFSPPPVFLLSHTLFPFPRTLSFFVAFRHCPLYCWHASCKRRLQSIIRTVFDRIIRCIVISRKSQIHTHMTYMYSTHVKASWNHYGTI